MPKDTQLSSKLSFSFPQACEATSLSRSSLYAAAKEGRLRVCKVGGRSIIMAEDLRAFLTGVAA